MRVKVEFRGQLALSAGADSVIELGIEPGMLLRELLEQLASSRDERFRELVFDAEGNCGATLFVAMNGEHVRATGAVIPEGTREIVIMPPIAGG
jgi:molybdopterin converting factor small subunit